MAVSRPASYNDRRGLSSATSPPGLGDGGLSMAGFFPRRAHFAAVVLILLLSLPARGEEDAVWPQFRGPGGLGVAQGKATLPVQFGPEKNVLWKVAIPKGLSSPCIWGKRIFLTSYDATTKKLETLCIDRDK